MNFMTRDFSLYLLPCKLCTTVSFDPVPINQTTSSEGCIGAVCNNGSDGEIQPTSTDTDESVVYPETECYLIQSSFEERFNVCGSSFNGPCVDFCVVSQL